MRKSKCTKLCPKGHPLVFNGKNKDGRQKYKCNQCRKIITENVSFKAGRRAKRLFNLLYNVINQDNRLGSDINDLFKFKTNAEYTSQLNKVFFKYASKAPLICKNPKLLIAVDDNNLIFYIIPKPEPNENSIHRYEIIDNEGFNANPEKNPHIYTEFK